MMKPAAGTPTDPRSFGGELRRLRESAGLLVEDISAETKVSVRVLAAMEDGAFQYLPERVFARNFVRQYARIIGFDEERLAGWFDIAWERFLSDSGTHPTVLAMPEAPHPTFRWWIWAPLVLIGIVIIIAGIVIWHQRHVQPFRTTRHTLARGSAGLVRPTGALPAAGDGERARTPTTPVPAQGQARVRFSLHVKPAMECWIRYRDVSGKIAQQLLRNDQKVQIEAPAPLTMTLGNAAGVVLTVGTKTYDDLGKPGEVLNLEITADGGLKVLRAVAQNE